VTEPSSLWVAAVIALATVVAIARLTLWWRAAPSAAKGPAWRFPVLIVLNLAAAALVYLTLNPPDVGLRSGRLIVLTAGAGTQAALEAGDVVVTLPEGPQDGAAERVPDLATALRRHAQVRSVLVLGSGLTARDRQPTIARPVVYIPPPAPPLGLTAVAMPDPIAPGAPFVVSGRVGAVGPTTVELVDPAGTVVDRAPVLAGATFALKGAGRAAGLALFDLRLKDAAGTVLERIEIPVDARAQPAPRVRVLAGAPGPETRFLRRWAEDAGIALSVQLSLGAGVDLTAAPAPLTGPSLAETDLLVIDERRWETLSAGERGAIRSAVAAGMGLLLRPTGPLPDATRREWAALGAPLSGGENTRPLALPGTADALAPTPAAPDESEADMAALELTRRDFTHGGADAVTLISDADGIPLASWRPYGAGRVGVWIVADSYALVLTGQADRYGEVWSAMFSALGRPEGDGGAALRGLARAGERATLCGVIGTSEVIGPDGRRSRLIVDPRSGSGPCAAFWPTRSGWHAIRSGGEDESAVYVHPAEATPSLIAAERRQATLDLAATSTDRAIGAIEASRAPGSPWPWFLALLAVLAGLWWLERYRPASVAARVP
jgi:hypothetical protein